MLFPNKERFKLVGPKLTSAVKRPASINAKTAPGAFKGCSFVMVSRIAQMVAMKALLLAKTIASHYVLRVILSSHATWIVV